MFVANKADNVTPLRSAQANAKGFPGSIVLIQDSYEVSSCSNLEIMLHRFAPSLLTLELSHTSLSSPSRCTVSAINAYFQSGELPAPGTKCPPDLVPFEKWNFTSLVSMNAEQIEFEVSMRELMLAPVPGMKWF